MKLSSHKVLMIVLILCGLLVPPVIFAMLYLQAPSISPEKARDIIDKGRGKSVLIDVRSAQEFEEFHLEGAINIPLAEIQADRNLPCWNELINREHIFLICSMGYLSAGATERLHRFGFSNAKNIDGGIDAWLAGGKRNTERLQTRVHTPDGSVPGARR